MLERRQVGVGNGNRVQARPPVSAKSGEQYEYLLLAPMDIEADAALDKALGAGGFEGDRSGPIFVMKVAHRGMSGLCALLCRHVSPALQLRIKAAIAQKADTGEDKLHAFLQSETLSVLIDQAEVGWARDMLRENRLFTMFQPIVEATTGHVFAYEALIRARHPQTEEIIGAGQILYAAERLNIQHDLDQLACTTAFNAAAEIGLQDTTLFVNFLPNAIYDAEICLNATLAAAQEVGLDMSRLVFEVTETQRIPRIERLVPILQYLREKGAGVALDDINSGFTSIQFMSDLNPDYVKLDRDLIAGTVMNMSARRTLDTVVRMAKKRNAKVIAEAVETRQQMQVCVEAGVDYVQGFLIARPANPPEEVRADVFKDLAHVA